MLYDYQRIQVISCRGPVGNHFLVPIGKLSYFCVTYRKVLVLTIIFKFAVILILFFGAKVIDVLSALMLSIPVNEICILRYNFILDPEWNEINYWKQIKSQLNKNRISTIRLYSEYSFHFPSTYYVSLWFFMRYLKINFNIGYYVCCCKLLLRLYNLMNDCTGRFWCGRKIEENRREIISFFVTLLKLFGEILSFFVPMRNWLILYSVSLFSAFRTIRCC